MAKGTDLQKGSGARPRIRKRELFAAPGKKLNAIAKRALHEAAERRRRHDAAKAFCKDSTDDKALEPTRYGDWANGGKCSDF